MKIKSLSAIIMCLLIQACGTDQVRVKIDCIDTSNYSTCEVTCLNDDTCKGE